MIIRDKIEEYGLYFVEQDLPKTTFYEVYRNGEKLYQSKNNFDNALRVWCETIQKYVPQKVS